MLFKSASCQPQCQPGACIQACRSDYDLVDSRGKVLVRNRPLLSLKDLNLSAHIPALIEAGITSFKIEGRLKNASYVKNVVREYRRIIDEFISSHPDYVKASAGEIYGGFVPDTEATFNRGYTSCFIEGKEDNGPLLTVQNQWESTLERLNP